jgi:hypothetical protein
MQREVRMRRSAPQDPSHDLAQCLFHDKARRRRALQAARCAEPELDCPDGAVATLSLLEDGRAVFRSDADVDPHEILEVFLTAIEEIRKELGEEQLD